MGWDHSIALGVVGDASNTPPKCTGPDVSPIVLVWYVAITGLHLPDWHMDVHMGTWKTSVVNNVKSCSTRVDGCANVHVSFAEYHGDSTDSDSSEPKVLSDSQLANYSTGPGIGESKDCVAAYRHVDANGNAS